MIMSNTWTSTYFLNLPVFALQIIHCFFLCHIPTFAFICNIVYDSTNEMFIEFSRKLIKYTTQFRENCYNSICNSFFLNQHTDTPFSTSFLNIRLEIILAIWYGFVFSRSICLIIYPVDTLRSIDINFWCNERVWTTMKRRKIVLVYKFVFFSYL